MKSELTEDPKISIADFIEISTAEMKFEILAGEESLDSKFINSPRIQKLGLALAGFARCIHSGRLQIFGQSETSYLKQLSETERIEALKNLDLDKICCILITKNLEPLSELLEIAEKNNLPLLKTPLFSSTAIGAVSAFLQKVLAPKISIHGVMLEIYGLGLLIQGESGIGKSECALDLITRGHRLISDDVVTIKKFGEILEGSSPGLTKEHLEIRGLGILNIRDLFGVSSIGQNKKIDLCIEFRKWDEVTDVDRLGLKMQTEKIFDVKIPKFILPVSSGRNLATLVETAVRVHLSKAAGHNAAQKLIAKHSEQLITDNG
ncbi:MAG: HPr(Ser) kinase/phosphatase [Aridibacter sp.]